MKYVGSIVCVLILALSACQTSTPNPVTSQPPVAAFTVSADQGNAPLTVSFDATGSSAPGSTIATYSWNFGDSASASGVTTNHTYSSPGTFTASLSVTNSQGLTASSNRTITISPESAEPSPDPQEPPTDDPTPPDEPSQLSLIAAGISIPAEKASIEKETSEFGLEAVIMATQATGGPELTVTGTLTQAADGNVSYSATPGDRLRLVFSNGASVEYIISALQGDFEAPSVEEFLRRPHIFSYRVITPNGTDVTISLERSGSSSAGAYQNSMQGILVSEETNYTVNLLTSGQFSNSVGNAVDYKSEEQVQGTVTSAGFSATVNEQTTFRYFQFENAIEVNTRSINNSWKVGNDSYSLTNGFIKRNFFNGKPSEFDLWRAEGTLTRGGVAVGGIGSEFAELNIDIFLEVDGEREILHSHLRN